MATHMYFKENHADYSVKCKIIYHSILSISNAMMPQMTEKKTQSSKESSKVQDFSSVYLYRYFNEVEFLQHKSEAFYCLTTFLPWWQINVACHKRVFHSLWKPWKMSKLPCCKKMRLFNVICKHCVCPSYGFLRYTQTKVKLTEKVTS